MPPPNYKGWALWLDDIRDPTKCLRYNWVLENAPYDGSAFTQYISAGWIPADFIWAKSAEEAIRFVRTFGPPAFMALDHDLGSHDVFHFLKWLANEHIDHPPQWMVHSANPAGMQNIHAFMNSWHKVRGNK